MLDVLITVDTETYPISKSWKQDRLASDLQRDLYGVVNGQVVGLEYQLETLAKHSLKACFMVESLFSAAPEVGEEPLRKIIRLITDGGHEVQLHPHPEWIPHVPSLEVPYRSISLRDFPLAEQEAIISFAKVQLEKSGARTPIAFRAGGFAANNETLIALERCGIKYDSSLNPCYEFDERSLPRAESYGHAIELQGVLEIPVAVFHDYPSHLRPAQICACGSAEMIHALNAAETAGWNFFVIVSHSFEMIARRWHSTKPPIVRQEVVRRFESLCRFLGTNRDRFRTVGFSDLRLGSQDSRTAAIKGNLLNTGYRLIEQTVARIRTR
jgi:hypothetical protein